MSNQDRVLLKERELWLRRVHTEKLESVKLDNINPIRHHFAGQTITIRGHTMLRELRCGVQRFDTEVVLDHLRSMGLISRKNEKQLMEELGISFTPPPSPLVLATATSHLATLSLDQNTPSTPAIQGPNSRYQSTPLAPKKSSSKQPDQSTSSKLPEKITSLAFPPNSCEYFRRLLDWMRRGPTSCASQSSAQALGAFATLWLALPDAWGLRIPAGHQRQFSPSLIREFSTQEAAQKAINFHPPPAPRTPSPPNHKWPRRASLAESSTQHKTPPDDPLLVALAKLEDSGYMCHPVTESVQADAFNNFINGFIATIQTGPYPAFIATSNQKRFTFGDKGSEEACFNACIDGYQRNLASSEVGMDKDSPPGLQSRPEYMSIFEYKAGPRHISRNRHVVDQVRRQETAEIAALAYTNRESLIAQAKRDHAPPTQLLFSVAKGVFYLTIAEMPLQWLLYISDSQQAVTPSINKADNAFSEHMLRTYEYGPLLLGDYKDLQKLSLVMGLLVSRELERDTL